MVLGIPAKRARFKEGTLVLKTVKTVKSFHFGDKRVLCCGATLGGFFGGDPTGGYRGAPLGREKGWLLPEEGLTSN